PPMIAQARALLATEEAAIQKRVRFEVADVTTLPFIERFTKVVSFRCLINLPSDEMQAKALARIATMLEPGGQALLSEDTSQGYDAINALRLSLGLPQMERRWHNNPIDEALVREICPSIGLVVEEIWDFSSSYYMISRAVNPLLAREIKFGKDFIPELDAIARQLPAVGNFGLLRLIRLRKTK
ncbi:MAG: class I SAM-dependent methyltransferase, partial [Alphaproteobacteria bacterium]|nr:class I SAM-dependent methyltransferase [Alphaproteobacteria bacterium]